MRAVAFAFCLILPLAHAGGQPLALDGQPKRTLPMAWVQQQIAGLEQEMRQLGDRLPPGGESGDSGGEALGMRAAIRYRGIAVELLRAVDPTPQSSLAAVYGQTLAAHRTQFDQLTDQFVQLAVKVHDLPMDDPERAKYRMLESRLKVFTDPARADHDRLAGSQPEQLDAFVQRHLAALLPVLEHFDYPPVRSTWRDAAGSQDQATADLSERLDDLEAALGVDGFAARARGKLLQACEPLRLALRFAEFRPRVSREVALLTQVAQALDRLDKAEVLTEATLQQFEIMFSQAAELYLEPSRRNDVRQQFMELIEITAMVEKVHVLRLDNAAAASMQNAIGRCLTLQADPQTAPQARALMTWLDRVVDLSLRMQDKVVPRLSPELSRVYAQLQSRARRTQALLFALAAEASDQPRIVLEPRATTPLEAFDQYLADLDHLADINRGVELIRDLRPRLVGEIYQRLRAAALQLDGPLYPNASRLLADYARQVQVFSTMPMIDLLRQSDTSQLQTRMPTLGTAGPALASRIDELWLQWIAAFAAGNAAKEPAADLNLIHQALTLAQAVESFRPVPAKLQALNRWAGLEFDPEEVAGHFDWLDQQVTLALRLIAEQRMEEVPAVLAQVRDRGDWMLVLIRVRTWLADELPLMDQDLSGAFSQVLYPPTTRDPLSRMRLEFACLSRGINELFSRAMRRTGQGEDRLLEYLATSSQSLLASMANP